MIAAASNRTAGILVAASAFLFLFAIGINAIYSMQSVCIDVLTPEGPICYNGYDALPEYAGHVVSPGLYLIALSLAAAGAAMMLAGRRKNAMRAIYKRLADARPEF